MKTGNSLIRSYYEVQMQVSKMKTINIMPFTKITMKSMCTARAYAMFLLTNRSLLINIQK